MRISIGQKAHEEKKFLATIKLINTSFKDWNLLINDSIQKHTMKITNSLSLEVLPQMAIKEDGNWLLRNKYALEPLTISYKIMRCDDSVANSQFKKSYQLIVETYHKNEIYKNATQKNISEFLSRNLTRLDAAQLDSQNAFQLCRDYLLEECAVMNLWIQDKYEDEVYPRGRNIARASTYELVIRPSSPNLLRSVALRFKKYPGKNIQESDFILRDNINKEPIVSIN